MLALALAAALPASGGEKRLVYYGWGTPDTTYVAGHCREVETAPFDGIGIQVALDREAWRRGATDTGNQLGWSVFGPRALAAAAFEPAVHDVRSCGWKATRDDFLPVAVSSQGQDHGFSWFDDERWKTVLSNWEIAVGVAEQSGLRGLILDPEHYGARLFEYETMRARADRDREAYRRQVAARGRALMRATARIFPAATILCVFGPSLARRDKSYDLWGAFSEGMLAAAPPGATIVDGYEFAYAFKTREQFEAARLEIRRAAASAERGAQTRVQVGFGLWLDYGKRWSATDPSANYFAPASFARALEGALAAADRYVWVYSQTPRFFPPANVPEAYLDALRRVRDGSSSAAAGG